MSSTRCFCSGVTLPTTETAFLWVLTGSRYSMVRSAFSPPAISCGSWRDCFSASCRKARWRYYDAAQPLHIGEKIHHPDLLGIHLAGLKNSGPVLQEVRFFAGDRRQRPILLGANVIEGGGFRHIKRVHLAARHRKAC